MSIVQAVMATHKSYSDELERMINTERVNLVVLKNAHVHALQRHKLELDQIIKWATDLHGDRCQATDAEYSKLITVAEDRIARLNTVNDAIAMSTILTVAPEHTDPPLDETHGNETPLDSLRVEAWNGGMLLDIKGKVIEALNDGMEIERSGKLGD